MAAIDREVEISAVDPDREWESPYDVHELPSLEEYDTDFAPYRQALVAEMNQWEKLGYEAIGVASHNERPMGFFWKQAKGRC